MDLRSTLCLFFLLSFCSSLVSAQEQKKARDNFQIIVKWAPSSLLTPETPTMQFGGELLFPKSGIGIEYDYGVPCQIVSYSNTIQSNPDHLDPSTNKGKNYEKHHFGFRKYFFNRAKIGVKLYAGAEGLHIPYRYHMDADFYTSGGQLYTCDYTNISKDITAGAVKFGVLFSRKQFTGEAFVGVGIRNVEVTYYDTENKQPFYGSTKYIQHNFNHEGTFTTPHLALGIKVGYRLVRL